ncbi:unnamed protein product, partial [Timema podura]|nr:unnamed protein product [Timema podura]
VGVVSSQQESPDIICLSSDEEDVKPIIGFPLYIDKASEPTVSEAHKPSSPFDPVVPQSSITVPTVVTTQDNHQLPSISSCVTKLSTVNDGVSSSIINNDTSKDLLLDSNPIALSCKSVERCSSPSSSESETFDLNPLSLINDSKKPFRLTKGCKRLSTIDEAIEAKIMRKEENDICPESLPIININKDIKTTCSGLASPNDIIIIDDEDEQFPSSQIFDSSPDPEENKASITEENKIDEFEDDLFQPENDLASSDEDEWFSKLSQNDKIENSSALEEQRLEIADGLALKNIIEEDSEEEIFSVRKQNSVKRTILDDEDEDEDEDNHDDESNESFTFGLPNNFRNDAQELDEKSKPPLEEISKSNEKFEKKSAVKLGKSLLIDAPPMPPRRASNRGISIAEAERLYNDKATLVSKHRKITEKKNLPSDQNDKSSGKRKHASSGKDSGSSKDLTKSSEKTKSLVDKRKAKLKEISQKHKESSEAVLNDNYNKVKAKARIKVTDKNRGAFLTEELNKSDKPSKISKESESKYIKTSSDINNIRPNFVESGHGLQESHSWKKKDTFKVANVSDKLNKPGKSLTTSKTLMKIAKTSLNSNVKPNNPPQESLSRKTTTNDNRKAQNDSSLLKKINTNLDEALPSCSNLQRIPRLSFKDLDNPGPMTTSVLSRTHQTPIRSTRGILVQQNKNKPETSNAFSKNCVGRKSVQFKDEEHLKEVHNFPLEETSLMKPVSMLKDKPFKKYNVKDVPYNEVANKYNYPSLDDVICKICTWKPTWFEEQKRCDHPPPIVNKNPKPMFTTFASYETYYSTLQPLMLMELWDKLTQAQAIKNPVVIISVDSFEPCTPSSGEVNKLSEIKCHSLYSHHELQGTKIPRTGDLVALELSLDSENSSEGGRRFTNTFGYLTATNLQTLNDHSIVHKSLC